ncbi:protein ripply2 [Onychostoma macrolepis]|uniref:protein ripply2 n=1 Tax=Onychostoma macrolepis TaxID=369639 RepID=UPI00272D60B5|nr:protein ripply2 [Onychostoma macrolepis]
MYSSASLSTDTMEKLTFTLGFNSETNATRPWRPWIHKTSHGRKTNAYKPYERASADDQHSKAAVMTTHPVKLFWPKSRCFDYLYQDAEILLRNYPVQATICLYEDSDSDDDDDSDEEHEKEHN